MADVVLPWRTGAAPKKPPPTRNTPLTRAAAKSDAVLARPVLPTTSQTGAVMPWRVGANQTTQEVQTQAAQHEGNLANLGHMVTGLPGAVGHLAKDVVTDPQINPYYEIRRGLAHPFGGGPKAKPGKVLPQAGKSIVRTGGDVAHPSRFVKAYKEGTLPSKILEDLANASIVGSAAGAPLRSIAGRSAAESIAARSAAEALTGQALSGGVRGAAPELAAAAERAGVAEAAAARLAPVGRVGDVLHSVGNLGAQGANLPAKPYELVAKGIRKAGAFEKLPGLGGESIAARLGETRLGEAGTQARKALAGRRTAREFAAAEIKVPQGTAHYDLLKDAPEAFRGLDPTEQRAAVLVADQTFAYPGTRAQLRLAEEQGGQAAVDSFFDRINKEAPKGSKDAAYAVTPEAAKIAIDFHEGTLAPEVAAKVGGLVDYLRTASEKSTALAVSGAGRISGPLNPEELGSGRLTEALQTKGVTRAEKLLAGRQEQAAAARAAVGPLEERGLGQEIAVEAKIGRAAPSIVTAGERQAVLEGGRARLADEAALHRAKADELLGLGQEKATALRGEAATARTEGLTLARLGQEVQQVGETRRAGAATLAEGHQGAAALPALAAEIGPAAAPEFRGALKTEAAGQRLGARSEQALAQEEALRLRATAAESTAVDAAALTEGRAVKAETRLAGLAGEAPLAATATRELGQTARAGERAGVAGERLNQAQQKTARAEGKVTTAQRLLEKERAKAWDRLDTWPAKYRYAGGVAREAAAAGSDLVAELRSKGADYAADAIQKALDEYPVTLEAMVKAGIDPIYLPGGIDPNTRVASGLRRTRGETALSQRKVGSEYERKTQLRPATPQGRLQLINQEQAQVIENIAADKFLTEHGRRPADVGVTETRDQQILDAMRTKDYEPWDPRQQGGIPRKITTDTVFLPTELRRAIDSYFKPANRAEIFLQHTFDPARRLWKDMVLPFSGTWQVGNVVSNAIMSTMGTGSLRWVTELPAALKMIREGTGPARLNRLGIEYPLDDLLRNKAGKRPNIARRAANKSYAANTFMDDWSRHSVYLAEHAKLLESGASATAAETQAIRSALKVSGDFNNLTHFEKSVVRRAAPFYAWARHVTQLVSYLAKEHPARLVWTLHLSDMFNDPSSSPFQGSVGVTGGIFSLGNLNPLGQFANLYANERGPLAGVLGTLGPEFDVAAAAGLGVNLGRGGAPLRLPPGESKLDPFGNPIPTALLGRPNALRRYALDQVPLLRTGRELVAGQKLARYDTGEPMLKGGHLIDSSPRILGTNTAGRLGILARQAGIPTATPFDVPAATSLAQQRIASAKKARERYAKQRKKAER